VFLHWDAAHSFVIGAPDTGAATTAPPVTADPVAAAPQQI
jgi:hypothetical protein